jgi:hypothetical protein
MGELGDSHGPPELGDAAGRNLQFTDRGDIFSGVGDDLVAATLALLVAWAPPLGAVGRRVGIIGKHLLGHRHI